ncbi:MAG: Holliday junction resolvase RecU [Kurthia sp.]|nr:Holliday junction resolvase RecU [Candidatus Kurthia equi]
MAIRYPNGRKYTPINNADSSVKKKIHKEPSYSNRGKTLEDEIDEANKFYLANQTAVIHKKPVPIQIVKVEYPSRSAAVIKEAYFRTPSTTDYNGVYKGHYIDFDAKETKNKTSFPLSNVHPHQINHMRAASAQGGICFLLVRFSTLSRYFVMPFDIVDQAWTAMDSGERKSIPLTVFERDGIEVKESYMPQLDYLKALTTLLPIL